MRNSVLVKPDISWIVGNYENPLLEEKAVQETIELCLKEKERQQVVNDSIQSFREIKVDARNLVELKAKETLIEVVSTKFLKEEQKAVLIQFLVERCYRGYEVNYSYIFDKNVA